MKKEFKVSESFIREAHKVACSEWKQKLEKQFPEVFTNSIQSLIDVVGKQVFYGYEVYGVERGIDDGYVFIPLPNANTEWTFAAFDYVKKFCTTFNAYPYHRDTVKLIDEVLYKKYPNLREERSNWLVISVSDFERK